MAMRRWKRGSLSVVGLCLLAGSASAQQQAVKEQTAASSKRATELFRQARALQAEGRFSLACRKFQESLRLNRSPGTLLNLGSCRKGEGNLLAAIETFRLAVREAEKRPPGKKRKLWLAAAQAALQDLDARIARLELRLPGGGELPESWSMQIDGQALSSRADGTLPQNPGRHRLEVVAPGREPYVREFELVDGEVLTVEVSLRLAREVSEEPEPAAAPLVRRDQEPEEAFQQSAWPVVLAGVGGGAVLAGAAAGLVSWGQTRDLRSDCEEGCPEGSSLGEANRWASVANVLVGTGVLVGAIGAVWWWMDEPPGAAEARRFESGRSKSGQGRLQLRAGCVDFQACALQMTGTF